MNHKNEGKSCSSDGYYRSENWRIVGFSLCCIAANLYDTLIGFILYYMTGLLGVSVVLSTSILMYMRVWDAVTDPVCGWLIDRTNGKYGKIRPFIVGGCLLMVGATYFMIFGSYHIPDGWRLLFFIVMYMLYVVGFTAQDSAMVAGQNCLTNDPSQRAKFGFWIALFITIRITFLMLFLVQVVVPHNGGFTIGFFKEAWILITIFVILFTVIAVFSLKGKDVPEFYSSHTGIEKPRYRRSDYWDVIKHNRPLRKIILATSADALALTSFTNAGAGVALYGIVCGNYELNGQIRLFTFIPCVIVLTLVLGSNHLTKKYGLKWLFVFGSAIGMVSCLLIILLFYVGDPTTLMFPTLEGWTGWSLFTILFLILSVGQDGAKLITNISVAMNADVIDYELYRSGNYVGGMLATMNGFVKKIANTFGTAIYGFLCAGIGFTQALPDITTPYTPSLKAIALFSGYGLMALGFLVNLIAMKGYSLDKQEMEKIEYTLTMRSMERTGGKKKSG